MTIAFKGYASAEVQEARSRAQGTRQYAIHTLPGHPGDSNQPSLHLAVVETLASSAPNTSLGSRIYWLE